LKIGGQEIKYTATAGTILLKLEDGTPKASIFYVAYAKDDVGDASQRPLTFSFNGGPGSASVWLHLGLLGPRRVQMGDAGTLLPPPYKLVDNDVSLLDISDLVFIDPVSTGYSRAVPGEAPKQFHGIEEDVESVADSSGSIQLVTSAGPRRNFSLAKATARPAPRAFPAISSSVTECTSTASS